MTKTVSPEELSAFIDGELPTARVAEIAAALQDDPALATLAAEFRRQKNLLAAAYAPVAQAPLPRAWLDQIEAATMAPEAPRRRTVRRYMPQVWALAACAVAVIGAALFWQFQAPGADVPLAEAEAARNGQSVAAANLQGSALPTEDVQRSLLRAATGLPVRVPDLRKLGWQLAGMRMFKNAAELRYADAGGKILTVYVRKSLGPPRSDLLRHGNLRICVDQDDTVLAVVMGDISAGQMIRAAGTAYADLDL